MEALEIMGQKGVNQLPVMSEDRLGELFLAFTLEALRSRAELQVPPSLPGAA